MRIQGRLRKLEKGLRPGQCPECRGHFVAQIRILEQVVEPGEPAEPFREDDDTPEPRCPACGRAPDDTQITTVVIVRPQEAAPEPSHAE